MSSKTTSWILELVDKITSPLQNVQGAADDTADSVERIGEELDDASEAGNRFGQLATEFGAKAFLFNQAADGISKFNSYFKDSIAPGVELQTQMADLSAVTQKTGDDLDAIKKRAKDLAAEFGGSASQQAESFKTIIARFGPSIADSDQALSDMGRSVAILSKSMGGDATAAADALSTAMLQYGVDLKNPIEASQEMYRMMNILVAGGAEGASEVSDTAEALKVAGLMAKMQGVNIESFTASMQTLADGALTGSQAGTKFLRVLENMAAESMIPKSTADALKAMGVDMDIVNDSSLKLTDRLRELRKASGTDLIMQMFGANASAAELLMQNIEQTEEYEQAIADTTAAVDAANIQMDTYAETMSRSYAKIDNFKESVFSAIEPITPFISLTGDAVSGVTNLGVAVWGLSVLFKKDLYTGIWAGIKAMGSWISTNVIAKVTTLATAAANWVLNLSLWASPITWIVGGIMVAVGAFALLWNKCEGFRAVVTGLWGVIKKFGTILKEFVIDRIKGLLSGIGAIGRAILKLFDGDFSGAWKSATEGVAGIVGVDAFKNAGKKVGAAYAEGAEAGRKSFQADKEKKEKEKEGKKSTSTGAKSIIDGTEIKINDNAKNNLNNRTNDNAKNTISGTGGSGGGKSITMNVTLNITNNGVKNPDEFTEQVVRKINDRLNDTLAAA